MDVLPALVPVGTNTLHLARHLGSQTYFAPSCLFPSNHVEEKKALVPTRLINDTLESLQVEVSQRSQDFVQLSRQGKAFIGPRQKDDDHVGEKKSITSGGNAWSIVKRIGDFFVRRRRSPNEWSRRRLYRARKRKQEGATKRKNFNRKWRRRKASPNNVPAPSAKKEKAFSYTFTRSDQAAQDFQVGFGAEAERLRSDPSLQSPSSRTSRPRAGERSTVGTSQSQQDLSASASRRRVLPSDYISQNQAGNDWYKQWASLKELDFIPELLKEARSTPVDCTSPGAADQLACAGRNVALEYVPVYPNKPLPYYKSVVVKDGDANNKVAQEKIDSVDEYDEYYDDHYDMQRYGSENGFRMKSLESRAKILPLKVNPDWRRRRRRRRRKKVVNIDENGKISRAPQLLTPPVRHHTFPLSEDAPEIHVHIQQPQVPAPTVISTPSFLEGASGSIRRRGGGRYGGYRDSGLGSTAGLFGLVSSVLVGGLAFGLIRNNATFGWRRGNNDNDNLVINIGPNTIQTTVENNDEDTMINNDDDTLINNDDDTLINNDDDMLTNNDDDMIVNNGNNAGRKKRSPTCNGLAECIVQYLRVVATLIHTIGTLAIHREFVRTGQLPIQDHSFSLERLLLQCHRKTTRRRRRVTADANETEDAVIDCRDRVICEYLSKRDAHAFGMNILVLLGTFWDLWSKGSQVQQKRAFRHLDRLTQKARAGNCGSFQNCDDSIIRDCLNSR